MVLEGLGAPGCVGPAGIPVCCSCFKFYRNLKNHKPYAMGMSLKLTFFFSSSLS